MSCAPPPRIWPPSAHSRRSTIASAISVRRRARTSAAATPPAAARAVAAPAAGRRQPHRSAALRCGWLRLLRRLPSATPPAVRLRPTPARHRQLRRVTPHPDEPRWPPSRISSRRSWPPGRRPAVTRICRRTRSEPSYIARARRGAAHHRRAGRRRAHRHAPAQSALSHRVRRQHGCAAGASREAASIVDGRYITSIAQERAAASSSELRWLQRRAGARARSKRASPPSAVADEGCRPSASRRGDDPEPLRAAAGAHPGCAS